LGPADGARPERIVAQSEHADREQLEAGEPGQKGRPRDTLGQSVKSFPPLRPEPELAGVGTAVFVDETAAGLLREHPAEPEIAKLLRFGSWRRQHGGGGFSLGHGTSCETVESSVSK